MIFPLRAVSDDHIIPHGQGKIKEIPAELDTQSRRAYDTVILRHGEKI